MFNAGTAGALYFANEQAEDDKANPTSHTAHMTASEEATKKVVDATKHHKTKDADELKEGRKDGRADEKDGKGGILGKLKDKLTSVGGGKEKVEENDGVIR